MRKSRCVTITLLLAIASLTPGTQVERSGVLLREGLYAEQVDGDLNEAIRIYEQIITDSSAQRSHAAQAMYRQGMCYLKKEDESKAEVVFRRLLAEYGDQAKITGKVKPILEGLCYADPATMMPADTLVYVEIGSPGKHVDTILDMLRGTPIESFLSATNEVNVDSQASPGDMLNRLLNPTTMAELKKVRSFAVGVVGITQDNPSVIAALDTGRSEVLHSLVSAALAMIGKPTEAMAGMESVVLPAGGRVTYDDNTVIYANKTAYSAGQLEWCINQYKGITSNPTLASGNRSFSGIDTRTRQANAITLWMDVDRLFASRKKALSQNKLPGQTGVDDGFRGLQNIDDFVNFESLDKLVAFLSIQEDDVSLEVNLAFKEGQSSPAYGLIRTPTLNKTAFRAVPSEAITLASIALDKDNTLQTRIFSESVKDTMGLDISGETLAHIDQLTLFIMPPSGKVSKGPLPIPSIATGLGLVVTGPNPEETRRVATRLLTAAKLKIDQSGKGQGEQDIVRYQINPGNGQTLRCHIDSSNNTAIFSLSLGVVEASAQAIRNQASAATTGPLSGAMSELPTATNKLALVNVGGAIRSGGFHLLLGSKDSKRDVADLLTRLAESSDKTTLLFSTHEELNGFNVRARISGLPPLSEVYGPIARLSKIVSEARVRARPDAKARIPVAESQRSTLPQVTPKYWKIVTPEPYNYMQIGASKIGLNTLFVRTREEAEEYLKQGARVEPWFQNTYQGFVIVPKK